MIDDLLFAVEVDSWKRKIEEDLLEPEATHIVEPQYHEEDLDSSFKVHDQYKDGVLTIGCCGKFMINMRIQVRVHFRPRPL